MSIGHKVGRAIGVVGALAVEGTVRGAMAAGQFGADALEGAEAGYTERSAQLLASRELKLAKAKAARKALVAQHQLALAAVTATETPVASPVKPAKVTA